MSSDIATRDDSGTTATRGSTAVAAGPASGSHKQAKDIGEAIVKRIAKRLNAVNDLRDDINADMKWITGQLSDLEAARIGGELVALWWDALMDGDIVHGTATTLANQIATMHDSSRNALRKQAHTGDTVSNVIAKVGEENVADSTDYYKD